MHGKQTAATEALLSFAALAAILAGCSYISRWVWELSQGILKNKQYPSSLITQNFFIVKVLMILSLAGLYHLANENKLARRSIIVACGGLCWTAITRTAEAHGAPGAWGFYSSPGLMLFFFGMLTTGISLRKSRFLPRISKTVTAIAALYFLGGLASMLLFNLLGRTESANATASSVANLLLIGEGICWMMLGLWFFVHNKRTALTSDDKKELSKVAAGRA